jgi:hypothetical protein
MGFANRKVPEQCSSCCGIVTGLTRQFGSEPVSSQFITGGAEAMSQIVMRNLMPGEQRELVNSKLRDRRAGKGNHLSLAAGVDMDSRSDPKNWQTRPSASVDIVSRAAGHAIACNLCSNLRSGCGQGQARRERQQGRSDYQSRAPSWTTHMAMECGFLGTTQIRATTYSFER